MEEKGLRKSIVRNKYQRSHHRTTKNEG